MQTIRSIAPLHFSENEIGLSVEMPLAHPQIHRIDHAGIRWSLTPGFITDAIELLGLRRLEGIHQLNFITALSVGETTPQTPPPHTFPHDRLEHSIVAALMAHEMLKQMSIAEGYKRAVVLGALVHDARTVAGGDMAKLSDPQLFDEDRDLGALFHDQKEGWDTLRARYALPNETPEIVQAMVDGKGLFGRLLDIADTCSYLALDTRELAVACARIPYEAIPAGHHEILSLAAQGACHIWQDGEIVGDHIVISGPKALSLYRFLLLRILLWRHLYTNPACRVLVELFSEIIFRTHLHQKKISRPLLLQWTDRELREYAGRVTGIPDFASNLNLFGSLPLRTSYATWQEALQAEEKLAQKGEFTLLYDMGGRPRSNDKTGKYFVLDRRSLAVTFESAHPDLAAVIKAYARAEVTAHPAHLVHFPRLPGRKIGKRLEKLWQIARARWHARIG